MTRPESLSRLSRKLLACLLALMPLLPAAAADAPDDVPMTDKLAAELARLPNDGVLVLMFSLPDCHYCEGVRDGYLKPLARDPLRRTMFRVREISLGLELPITDFDGSASTIQTLSKRLKLHMAPTLMFVDRCGRELADRLVGGDVAGFYNSYFEQTLKEARAKAKETAGLACTAS